MKDDVPAMLRSIAAAVAGQQATCAVAFIPGDVPKLYAVHQPSGTTGPHEIVCAVGTLDVWTSPDGRNPQPVRMDVSASEATQIVVQDYHRLKGRYLGKGARCE